VLRIGGLSALGLSLPELLQAHAAAAERTDVNCILLWLMGGPPQHETFDPKPEAPAEVRGEFGSSGAKTGFLISDRLPRLAQVSDRYSVIRTVTHRDNNHDTARVWMQSGYQFNPAIRYPSYGSVVSREKGWSRGLPAYTLLGARNPIAEGAGYLGTVYNPLSITGDPSRADFSVTDTALPSGVTTAQFDRRQRMLAALDRFQRKTESRATVATAIDQFQEKAVDLVTSPAAKKAFALSEESANLRAGYGKHRFGQSCLLARRLVEAGVRFVTVGMDGWDTHQNNFVQCGKLLPMLDQGYAALLQDLSDRGMLSNTLVLCFGEFGRTPNVNTQAGRDHWASTFCATLGGGPVKLGQVVGSSDKLGATPAERPVKAADLAATIYKALGIDYRKEYPTPAGRPTPIVYEGEPVRELF
jgi:hypothetical protein